MESYLGVDVSKGYADLVLLDKEKRVIIESFQLDDTYEGHRELHNTLSRFFREHPGAVVFAGVESTGGYENSWFARFKRFKDEFDIRVARLNPSGVNYGDFY